MKVQEVMSGSVHCVRADDDIAHARREMLRRGLGQLPVIDEGERVLGMVGVRDLAEAIGWGTGRGAPQKRFPTGTPVREFMKPVRATVNPAMPVEEAARLLLEHGVAAAPVTKNEDNRMVLGLVSTHDLLGALEGHGALNRVAEVARPNLPGVPRQASMATVLEQMRDWDVREVAVRDDRGDVQGRSAAPPMNFEDDRAAEAYERGIVGTVSLKGVVFSAWFDQHVFGVDPERTVGRSHRIGAGGPKGARSVTEMPWIAELAMDRRIAALRAGDTARHAARAFRATGAPGMPVLMEGEPGYVDRQDVLRLLVEHAPGV